MLMWWRSIRCQALLGAILAGLITGDPANASPSKDVLVLNSTRHNEQFYVVSEREMPRLLADGLGQRVNVYSEYLDANRFPQSEHPTTYVDFLRRKYAGQHFDLVLLMGDPAVEFMASHRSELFPATPAVFYALIPPRHRIANSTGLINEFRFGPSIDLALALQPDLERVYVVSGAAPSDREFERLARAEFRRFDRRLQFIYLSGLVTKDLEERLRALPPHSAVYYVVASMDGGGDTFQQMSYLTRVASAATPRPTVGPIRASAAPASSAAAAAIR